jgi:hypothetical protein
MRGKVFMIMEMATPAARQVMITHARPAVAQVG